MENIPGEYSYDLFHRINPQKRDCILTAAVKEFAKFGYDGANVNRIARSAGISVGALYKYFKTKQDLYLHIAEDAAQTIQKYVDGILREDSPVLEKIEALLRVAYRHSVENPDLIKLYDIFTSDTDETRAAILAEKLERVTAKTYRDLIAEAQEKGEVRKDVVPEILALMIDNQLMAIQFSFANQYYRRRMSIFLHTNDPDVDKLIAHTIKVVKRALEGDAG